MSEQASWVDEKFVQRLQSRSTRPGVVALNMGQEVVSRVEKMTGPQTLLQELGQRWQSTLTAQGNQIPFVYAQPSQPEPEIPLARRAGQPVASMTKTKTRQAPSQPVTTAVSQPTTSRTESDLILAPEKRPSHTSASQPASKPEKAQTAVSSSHKNKPGKTAAASASTIKKTTAVLQNPVESAPQPVASAPSASEPVTVSADAPAAPLAPVKLTLPIVQAKARPAPPTAVSPPPAPQPAKAKTKGTPVSQLPAGNDSSIVVVAAPPTAPTKSKMPIVSTTSPPTREQAKPIQVTATKPKATSQPPLPTLPRPLVKPQPPAPKTTPAFPSATGTVPTENGRNNTFIASTAPLPVVRATAVPGTPMTTALPLPKVAPLPSPGQAVTSTSSPAAASGVIQRSPDNEAITTGEASSDSEPSPVDINEIVAEVQRQFRRELAIEGERRGATSWY